MTNKYFTLLVIPEKTSKVRKLIIPVKYVKVTLVSLSVFAIISSILMVDYIAAKYAQKENTQLFSDNMELKEQVKLMEDKVGVMTASLDRIKDFSNKLRIITNTTEEPSEKPAIGPLTQRENEIYQRMVSSYNSFSALPEKTSMLTVPFSSGKIIQSFDSGDEHYQGILSKMKNLKLGMEKAEKNIHDLYEIVQDQKSLLASTPSVMPVNGWITSGFGWRDSVFSDEGQSVHEGIDIGADIGTSVRASADGVVVFAGVQGRYGKLIILNHGYGYETRYGHNSELMVKTGQRVKRNQIISKVGSTGYSTGPHLHYEVRINRIPRNPKNYILSQM